MRTKTCAKCKQDLFVSEFQADAQKSDGLRSWCRPCRKIISRSYIEKWKAEREKRSEPVEKICSKCRTKKQIKSFVRDSCRHDGFHVWCTGCRKPFNKETRRRYKEKNPDKVKQRARDIIYKSHSINESIYSALIKKQNGACAICKNPPKTEKNLHVDHCHRSNKIRGLLCGNCNRAIGQLQDSPEVCREAAVYLER